MIKICQFCGQEFNSSPSNNRKFCSRPCSDSGRIKMPWNKGLTTCTDNRVARYGAKLKGRSVTIETKLKISAKNLGKIPWNKNRSGLQTGYWNGRHRDASTIRKMRLATIARLNACHGQVFPAYNPVACRYFDRLMEETGTHIQHAENGGEFFVAGLGYWVDGYDAENNIVYEFDERHHNLIKYKAKDIRRQQEIESHLNCTFIRIPHDKN